MMKKVLAALLLAALLLPAGAYSQSGSFKNYWLGLFHHERFYYLVGYNAGVNHAGLAFQGAAKGTQEAQDTYGRLYVGDMNFDTLADVITNLYKDPANELVQGSDMIEIARDKIRGLEIEEKLRKARQEGKAFQEYLEKEK